MKKKLAAMLILAMTAGLLAVGCGKEKETEMDVVDLTWPPVVTPEEEEEPEAEEAAPSFLEQPAKSARTHRRLNANAIIFFIVSFSLSVPVGVIG